MLATTGRSSGVSRAPRPSSLADVLDLILDKGLVVDAYVRISVAGIEVLTIDARVVVASVDTYLRFAEAVNRLDLSATAQPGIEALTGRSGHSSRSSGDGDGDGDGDDAAGPQEPREGPERDEHQHEPEQPARDDDDEDSPGIIGRLAERARFDR